MKPHEPMKSPPIFLLTFTLAAITPSFSEAGLFSKKPKKETVEIQVIHDPRLDQFSFAEEDREDFLERFAQVRPSTTEGEIRMQSLPAVIGVELAVDALVAFLEAEAAKHQATFSHAVFLPDLEKTFSSTPKPVGLQIIRREEGLSEPAARAAFLFVPSGSGYLVHPIYLRVDSSKARVWKSDGRRKETVTINAELEYVLVAGSAPKGGTLPLVSFTISGVEIGRAQFFRKEKASDLAASNSKEVLQLPDTVGIFAPPNQGTGKVSATVSETDESRAARMMKKAAEVLKGKKADIVKVVLD